MIDKRVDKLEEKVEEIEEDAITSKQMLSSISKDIHTMSISSTKLENAVSELLKAEMRFQLHAQEDKQYRQETSVLIKTLFKRVDNIETFMKTVDKDHEVVNKLSSIFWSIVGWGATIVGGGIVMAMVYIAKNGGFGK